MHSESLSIVAECAQAVSVHGGVGGVVWGGQARTTGLCSDLSRYPGVEKKKNQTSFLNRLNWSEAQSGGERFLSWTTRLRILSAHCEYWWEIEDNTQNYHSMVVAQNNDDMKNKGLILLQDLTGLHLHSRPLCLTGVMPQIVFVQTNSLHDS